VEGKRKEGGREMKGGDPQGLLGVSVFQILKNTMLFSSITERRKNTFGHLAKCKFSGPLPEEMTFPPNLFLFRISSVPNELTDLSKLG